MRRLTKKSTPGPMKTRPIRPEKKKRRESKLGAGWKAERKWKKDENRFTGGGGTY